MKTFGKCILALLGVAVLLFCIGKMKAPDEALAYRERRPDSRPERQPQKSAPRIGPVSVRPCAGRFWVTCGIFRRG